LSECPVGIYQQVKKFEAAAAAETLL